MWSLKQKLVHVSLFTIKFSKRYFWYVMLFQQYYDIRKEEKYFYEDLRWKAYMKDIFLVKSHLPVLESQPSL